MESRLETYPPPYPNGWYHLADSDQIPRGRSLALDVFGRRLLILRSDVDGKASVLDGYCPHLGAALDSCAVKDGCVRCPFHGWTFDGEGKVRHIPYAEKIPKSLKTRTWPVVEVDGQIFAWHSSSESGEPEPTYQLESPAEIASGEMVYRGRKDGGNVQTHVVEILENSGDPNHFPTVHGRFAVPWTPLRVPFVGINITSKWAPDPERPHVAWMKNFGMMTFAGRSFPVTGAQANVEFVGPGSVVRFHFEREKVGRVLLYHTQTPIAPMTLRTRFRWYAEPRVPRLLVLYLVGHWLAQWREDVAIWEKKIFRPKPHLVAEDGPILEVRRWYRQFYQPAAPLVRLQETRTASAGQPAANS